MKEALGFFDQNGFTFILQKRIFTWTEIVWGNIKQDSASFSFYIVWSACIQVNGQVSL